MAALGHDQKIVLFVLGVVDDLREKRLLNDGGVRLKPVGLAERKGGDTFRIVG